MIKFVSNGAIIIRPAEEIDVEQIQKVLHNEGEMWDIDKIVMNIKRLFILIYQNKIIGVLYGNLTPHKFEISWGVVHPMYPENSIRTAMRQAIGDVLMHQP